MKSTAILLIFSLFIIACDSKPEDKLMGSWEVTYENFELNSFQNKDTLVTYDIDYTNPGEKRVKEVKYYKHEADSVLISWTMRPGKVKTPDVQAKWYVNNDTLFYEFPFGSQKMMYKMVYKFIGKNYEATVKGDFDRDGADDDIYVFEAKPIKK